VSVTVFIFPFLLLEGGCPCRLESSPVMVNGRMSRPFVAERFTRIEPELSLPLLFHARRLFPLPTCAENSLPFFPRKATLSPMDVLEGLLGGTLFAKELIFFPLTEI